ncbi:MAG: hypothetical protein WA949_21580 [Phormidesmis sp.]
MTSVRTKRPKITRWLSPLLLVSLGLHGLGLLVPVPKEAEVPEDVEELALDSIQVSILPAEPSPNIPAQTVSPEVLSPQVPPQVPPQALVESPPPEPIVEEPAVVSRDDAIVASELAQEAKTDTANPTNPGPGKQPKTGPFVSQQYNSEGTEATYDGFYAMSRQADTSLVPEFVKGAYQLDYLGNECFEEIDTVQSQIGVVVESLNGKPQIIAGDIIQRTGYEKANAALQAWLDNLKSGGEGEGPNLQIESTYGGESIYNWIFEQKKQVWFVGKTHEAYFFGIVVNLVNNTCQ